MTTTDLSFIPAHLSHLDDLLSANKRKYQEESIAAKCHLLHLCQLIPAIGRESHVRAFYYSGFLTLALISLDLLEKDRPANALLFDSTTVLRSNLPKDARAKEAPADLRLPYRAVPYHYYTNLHEQLRNLTELPHPDTPDYEVRAESVARSLGALHGEGWAKGWWSLAEIQTDFARFEELGLFAQAAA